MKEKNKGIIKWITLDRIIKLSIVFAVLLISSSLFYYYVIFLPQKEEARLEQERQEQLAKKQKEQEAQNRLLLEKCVDEAQEAYRRKWNKECQDGGLEIGCSLPEYNVKSFIQFIDYCYEKYPIK